MDSNIEINYNGNKRRLKVPKDSSMLLKEGTILRFREDDFGKIIGMEIIDPNTDTVKHFIPTINNVP